MFPPAAGIDISDESVKWIVLEGEPGAYRVAQWGEVPIREGALVEGAVRDVDALAEALREVRTRLGRIEHAHAALPEEPAYVFGMEVPSGSNREQTVRMIEFEFEGRIPMPPSASVFDYDLIGQGDSGEIAVSAFPRDLVEHYIEAFDRSGLGLMSLEVEARSVARAVSPNTPEAPVSLLVDFGRARSGLALLQQGEPIFTTTVAVGGETMNAAVVAALSISPEEAVTFRNEQGLLAEDGPESPGVRAILPVAESLAAEIARHYQYWDTRRNERGDRMTPVNRIILTGGSANLRGLSAFIEGRVHAPVILGDVWQHACNYDAYIPPIPKRASLQYATAIGLALRSLIPV